MDSHFDDLLRGHLGRLFKNERMSIAGFQQWFMTAWWEAEEACLRVAVLVWFKHRASALYLVVWRVE